MQINLKEILHQWQTNPQFREGFKKNPLQALQQAGFEVTPEDLAKIEATLNNNKTGGEDLDERINK